MNKLQVSVFAAFTCLIPALALADDPQLEVVDIDSRRELFVDHHLIEKLDGARLTLHRPQPREVAMKFDQPWEGNTSGYPTVMRDGELFKMIYRGHRMVWDDGKLQMSHSPVVCYAESRDGINWTKPNLGQFPLLGKMAKQVSDPLANNIVWPGSSYSGTFVPLPDAIAWKKSEEAIFEQGALDSMNVVFWEPH